MYVGTNVEGIVGMAIFISRDYYSVVQSDPSHPSVSFCIHKNVLQIYNERLQFCVRVDML